MQALLAVKVAFVISNNEQLHAIGFLIKAISTFGLGSKNVIECMLFSFKCKISREEVQKSFFSDKRYLVFAKFSLL